MPFEKRDVVAHIHDRRSFYCFATFPQFESTSGCGWRQANSGDGRHGPSVVCFAPERPPTRHALLWAAS